MSLLFSTLSARQCLVHAGSLNIEARETYRPNDEVNVPRTDYSLIAPEVAANKRTGPSR